MGEVFRNIETEDTEVFAMAKSGFPSPSKSLMATDRGFVPVVKSTFAAKDPVVIEPLLAVFLNIEMEALP